MNYSKLPRFSSLVLYLGLTFLYLPLLILIINSFNASTLSSAWSGFSTKWYIQLFNDEHLLSAMWRSLCIAFHSANTAIVIGLMSAFILVKFDFFGKNFFSVMLSALLVVPDIILGLSLLLVFIAMYHVSGWPPERGIVTIWIAHATFSSAYVAIIVSTKLKQLGCTLEEAALDLGTPPIKTFFLITIPLITPALITGWLLAFTLSLDDLVISSFVSGPGSTTLPMAVFSSVRLGISPKINALTSLFLFFVGLLTTITFLFFRYAYSEKRNLLNFANSTITKQAY